MRFPVSFDMLDPALCVAWRILKLLLKLQKLLLLLAWSLMQGPHNSIKKQVILKKSELLFHLTFYRKKGLFTEEKGTLSITFYYQYPGHTLNDEK